MKLNIKDILKIIEREYNISIINIEQLNLGVDINSTLYKAHSIDQKIYFLKIRSGEFYEASIEIPYWLSKYTGSKNIINPIETKDKKLYVKISDFTAAIFPFIDGKSGWDINLTNDRFVQFGKFMKELHSGILPEEYLKKVFTASYNQEYKNNVKEYLKNINIQSKDNIVIKELEINKNTIMEIINFMEKTSDEIIYEKQNICLCHGDIHAGNILISSDNIYIVDWDTLILAPKEKDLMFIGGGIGKKWNTASELEYFYKGYGLETEINKTLLKYYRCERIIQDIFYLYNEIISSKTEDKEKMLRLEIIKQKFESKDVVEMALMT